MINLVFHFCIGIYQLWFFFYKRIGRGKCKWMWWRSPSSTSAGNGRQRLLSECARTQSTVFQVGVYPNLCTATWQDDQKNSLKRTRNGPKPSTKDFNPASADVYYVKTALTYCRRKEIYGMNIIYSFISSSSDFLTIIRYCWIELFKVEVTLRRLSYLLLFNS